MSQVMLLRPFLKSLSQFDIVRTFRLQQARKFFLVANCIFLAVLGVALEKLTLLELFLYRPLLDHITDKQRH